MMDKATWRELVNAARENFRPRSVDYRRGRLGPNCSGRAQPCHLPCGRHARASSHLFFVLHCSSHSIIGHVAWFWSACHPVSSDSKIHPLLSDSVHCKPLGGVVRRRWLGVHGPISLPYLRTPTCFTNRILKMAVMQLLAKCGNKFS